MIGRVARRVGLGRVSPQAPREGRFDRYEGLDTPELVGGPTPWHDATLDARPALVVLLPHLELDKMSGGPNTAFQITARLAAAGTRVRYVSISGRLAPDEATLLNHLQALTGLRLDAAMASFSEASQAGSRLALGRGDILMATYWPTAHVAQRGLAVVDSAEFLYLVQDFEPGFYPWSTKYAMAAATYAMPMRAIVNETLLMEYLRREEVGRFAGSGATAHVTFTPAVDRALFKRAAADSGARHTLTFYARPRNPRNLFELGLRALRVAAAERVFDDSEWHFQAIGQTLPDFRLSRNHVLRALPWLSYDTYAALLGRTDLLLALMLSPHTSYPPLEMAATGGLVVTNTFGPKTASALNAISSNIRAAAPTLDALVECLRQAVRTVELGKPGATATGIPQSWDDALRDVLPWLENALSGIRPGEAPVP